MESKQFETLMLAISGLRNELKSEISGQISGLRNEMKSEFARLETKMNTGFVEVRKEMHMGFTDVRKDLKIVRDQVGQTHVDVTSIQGRVTRLEGSRA